MTARPTIRPTPALNPCNARNQSSIGSDVDSAQPTEASTNTTRHKLRPWFERAFVAAQRRCTEMDVQLLDETVYLRRLWFKRNDHGILSLWRAFYFEFTVNGADRYFGRVIMLGPHITHVELDPHRLH